MVLQWSDTEAKHTFPWLKLSEHHHFYQHDGGFKPAECQKICTWYSHLPHNNLLVSLLNLFGDTRTALGNPSHNSGPLKNLT